MSDICYLCGKAVTSDRSRDHVPPQQLFATSLRRVGNLDRLVTLPTHGQCNRSYSHDEEYFVQALVPLAMGTSAANAILSDSVDKFKAGKTVPLTMKILSEFEARPSGLYLPGNRIIKRLEGGRIKRVAWKIVRGLDRHLNGRYLPEDTTYALEVFEPDNREESDLANVWEHVKAQESQGVYPGVFDYKYLYLEKDGHRAHAWGMLLWDRIMMFLAHFHPGDSLEPAAP